jgi:hypothetical protein
MEDTFTCPNCNMDNAYFDGVMYVCPNCNHEWSDQSGSMSKQISSDFDVLKPTFNRLIKLPEPYFRLKHGKLYRCKVEHSHGIEDVTIIPLAFEKDKNQQFVMTDARKLFTANSVFVQEIIKMNFRYIMNDGIRSYYPFDYGALTILCTTNIDGTLIDFDGSVYFDFNETEEI